MFRQRLLTYVLLLFVLCVCMPVVIVRGCNFHDVPRSPTANGDIGPYVQLYRCATGTIEKVQLEEYVKGVVAAEMPASFHLEALKAQAVLARTHIVRRMLLFGGQGDPDHPPADVSDDPARGQAWLDETMLRQRWGLLEYAANWGRVEQAVSATEGLIAVYGGEPIEAAYHSTCGGMTESASEVWQVDLPYYTPVVCTWDQHSPYYDRRVVLSWSDLEGKLGMSSGALSIPVASGGGKSIVSISSRTAGGRVAAVRLGDLNTTGVALRKALGLPSANFEVTATASGLTFSTRGYGHGVGMCQYGADGMARTGKTFAEIISYYMPGVTVRQIFHE